MKIKNIYLLKQFIKYIAWSDSNNNLKEIYEPYSNNNYYCLYDLLNNNEFLNNMLETFEDEEIEKEDLLFMVKNHTLSNYYFD